MVGTVAVIGGSGALGQGIAVRLARAGVPVIIGSRDAEKAASAAAAIAAEAGSAQVTGLANAAAAEAGETVVVAVPFASQAETLATIAPAVRGKVVIDTTVPLMPPKVALVQLPPPGSAAAIAAKTLGPETKVVTAFHNVSAKKLHSADTVECDVLYFGDDPDACGRALDLIGQMGLRGVYGGPLANSVAAEAMTSVLITINRRYKVSDGAGIRITGLPDAAS